MKNKGQLCLGEFMALASKIYRKIRDIPMQNFGEKGAGPRH